MSFVNPEAILQALDAAVGVTRERCWKMPWVIELDIKGLFDNIHRQ